MNFKLCLKDISLSFIEEESLGNYLLGYASDKRFPIGDREFFSIEESIFAAFYKAFSYNLEDEDDRADMHVLVELHRYCDFSCIEDPSYRSYMANIFYSFRAFSVKILEEVVPMHCRFASKEKEVYDAARELTGFVSSFSDAPLTDGLVCAVSAQIQSNPMLEYASQVLYYSGKTNFAIDKNNKIWEGVESSRFHSDFLSRNQFLKFSVNYYLSQILPYLDPSELPNLRYVNKHCYNLYLKQFYDNRLVKSALEIAYFNQFQATSHYLFPSVYVKWCFHREVLKDLRDRAVGVNCTFTKSMTCVMHGVAMCNVCDVRSPLLDSEDIQLQIYTSIEKISPGLLQGGAFLNLFEFCYFTYIRTCRDKIKYKDVPGYSLILKYWKLGLVDNRLKPDDFVRNPLSKIVPNNQFSVFKANCKNDLYRLRRSAALDKSRTDKGDWSEVELYRTNHNYDTRLSDGPLDILPVTYKDNV